jgi:hypothetical protein
MFKDSNVPYGIIVKPYGDLPNVSLFLILLRHTFLNFKIIGRRSPCCFFQK